MFVGGQIPQRPMSARIEHGIKLAGRHAGQFHRVGKPILRRRILLEAPGCIGLRIGNIAAGIEGRLTALR